METVLSGEGILDRLEDRFVARHSAPANLADQMMMMALIGVMVNSLVGDFALENAAKAHQKVERAVDSRLIDAGHPGLNKADNLVSGQVVGGAVNDVQDQLALRRKLKSFTSEDGTATHCDCTWLQL